MDDAVEAYKIFDEGSPKKFVIDPHGMTGKSKSAKATTAVSKELGKNGRRPMASGVPARV